MDHQLQDVTAAPDLARFGLQLPPQLVGPQQQGHIRGVLMVGQPAGQAAVSAADVIL